MRTTTCEEMLQQLVTDYYDFYKIKNYLKDRLKEIIKEEGLPLHSLQFNLYKDAYFYAGAKATLNIY